MINASDAPTGPDVACESRDEDSSAGESPDGDLPAGEFSLRWLIGSIFLAGVLPASLVLACYFQQGFVPAGRCATLLVMPISLVWIGLLAVTIWNAGLGRFRSACIAFGFFTAWSILGNGSFNQALMSWVEAPLVASPHPEFERWTKLPAEYPGSLPIDAAVTLGGSASLVLDDFEEVNSEGERILSAAQAYHSGMTKTIITTGTSSDGIGNPSEVGRELLASLGVPDEAIFSIEGENTTQEMASLAAFLDSPPQEWLDRVGPNAREQPTIGVISSAFHIPRAIRLASNKGLDLIPLPCAYRNNRTERPFLASNLVPNADAHVLLGLSIKEIMAWVLGR
ncbi:YdcF family protein [Rhodopirellula sallentina]|uniref:Membrane protein containing DUF218 n=1 Tax=Rhodopirellula sallentina SM41 TaxID=1263870 RepID=M5TSH3_9BACT|nr:YdcF family protein [Rhodopirellula sallentina]EMI52142.1 membrane protein containing DUF218 [Rhodopirellula sallentina SM41]